MFSVYVLYSVNFNKIYIGYSSDVPNRLKSHNELAIKGWTVKFRPWTLVFTEEFLTKPEALRREKNLKGAKKQSHFSVVFLCVTVLGVT